jgi:hypothetical protein
MNDRAYRISIWQKFKFGQDCFKRRNDKIQDEGENEIFEDRAKGAILSDFGDSVVVV